MQETVWVGLCGGSILIRKSDAMLSQLFILSPRGDVIIRKDFLGDVQKNAAETFFRHCKFWSDGDEAPPVFAVDGVTYLYTKEGGLQILATTRQNVSPSLYLEFLRRLCTIIKDYCGMMNEDAVRKNFALIYEVREVVRIFHAGPRPVTRLGTDIHDPVDR